MAYEKRENIRLIDLDCNYYKNYKKNYFFRQILNLKKYFKHIKELQNIINKEKPDYVVSLGYEENIIFPFLKRRNCKFIREFHNPDLNDILYKNKKKLIFQRIKNFLNNSLLKDFDIYIFLTEEDKQRRKNLQNKKSYVINNFITVEAQKIAKLQNKKALSVGRLEYQKGYDILIDVWKKVSEAYPEWKLEIYGTGKDRKKLSEKIERLNLTKNIFLKGQTNRIEEKYIESSIYILSSRYEGMPLVLIEAQSFGIPVVAFDSPCGPKEIIQNGENGFLCKFDDIREMSNKIIYLIENEEKRVKMGKLAKESTYKYQKDYIMNKWKKMLEKEKI